MLRSVLLLTLGCLVLPWTASGQSETGEPDENGKPKGRLAWIMATSLPKDVESPIKVLIGEDELVEVKIMKRQMGRPIKIPKEGMLHVVKPVMDSEGDPGYERHVSVKVPDGVKKALVVLSPVPNLPAPLKFRARVVDLDKFKGGDALFVNLTGVEIGVVLGDQKRTLEPGDMEMIDLGQFDGSKNAIVSYHYRAPGEEKWNLISASTTVLRSTRREMLIFSYDEQLGQVDYHGISFHGED